MGRCVSSPSRRFVHALQAKITFILKFIFALRASHSTSGWFRYTSGAIIYTSEGQCPARAVWTAVRMPKLA